MVFIPRQTSQDMLAEAEAIIPFISAEDALSAAETAQATPEAAPVEFIDLRVLRELHKTGIIRGAHSVPRGLLEFWLDQNSPYARDLFARRATFVFYCDNGWRATLATKLALDMGLQNALCLRGGLDAWVAIGGPVEPYGW